MTTPSDAGRAGERAVWLNADGTTSPILPATTASALPNPESPSEPSQEFLQALVAAEQDRLRAEGWQACIDYIRRQYDSWLTREDMYWTERHNPFRTTPTDPEATL